MAKREKREEMKGIIITKEELEEIIKDAIKHLYSEYFIERLSRIEDDIKDIKRLMGAKVKKEKMIERIEEEYGSLEELERILIEMEKVDVFFKVFNILTGKDNKPVEEKALITALVDTGKFTEDEANVRIKSSLAFGIIYEVKKGFYKMRGPAWIIR